MPHFAIFRPQCCRSNNCLSASNYAAHERRENEFGSEEESLDEKFT